MATSINKGVQSGTFKYREEARSRYFNKVLDGVLTPGIYEGGVLRRHGDTQVRLEPLVCLIKSGNPDTNDFDISLRVETTADQTISVENSGLPGNVLLTKPYIVLRYDWAEQENNFMDMIPVAYSDDPGEIRDDYIQPRDLIVGKILTENIGGFDVVKVIEADAFDYTRRNVVYAPDAQDEFDELKVQSSETDSNNKVYVTRGSINTSTGRVEISGGNYPALYNIQATTASGARNDIVYLNELGEIHVEEGIPDLVTPVTPDYLNRKVIAEIHRLASRTNILGPDIRKVKIGRQGTIAASGFPIEDVGDYFVPANENLESAIQQLASAIYDTILGPSPGGGDAWIKDYNIDWGTGAQQVSAVDIPIADVGAIITATDVEAALQEIMTDLNSTTSGLVDHVFQDANVTLTHGIDVVTTIV